MPGERTSFAPEWCWGEKYEGVVAGVADAEAEAWLVGVRVGLEGLRERTEGAVELVDEGRRKSEGLSEGD